MIKVMNREMLIPAAERYIGSSYDTNSENRQFKIARFITGGVDLSALSFAMDLQYEDETKDRAMLSSIIEDENIILTLELAGSIMAHPGTVMMQISANDENGTVKWASFKAAFYIYDTIGTAQEVTPDLTELEQLEAKLNKMITDGEALYDEGSLLYADVLTKLNAGELKGDKGDPGPKGDAGVKGDTGSMGPRGFKGDPGPAGPTGAQGPQGDRGERGAVGATGPAGPEGAQGPEGPQGIQGPDGAQGEKGDRGSDGVVTTIEVGQFCFEIKADGNLYMDYNEGDTPPDLAINSSGDMILTI